VRELQNVIEQLSVLTDADHSVEPGDVPIYEDEGMTPSRSSGFSASMLTEPFHAAKEKLIASFEQEYVGELINRAGSNMSKAARLASIDRTTLYRLMEKHGFRRDDAGNSSGE
jgi:DNA-binding NtrC family response regulator